MTIVSSYYVLNGHTLGYIQHHQPGIFGVLHGNPYLGARDWKNGPVILMGDEDLVPATLADFDRFRVCPPPGWSDDCASVTPPPL